MLRVIFSLLLAVASATAPAGHVNHDALKKLSWQLVVPTDALGPISVGSAAERFHTLTVHHLELKLDQPWNDGAGGFKIDETTTDAQAAEIVATLKKRGMDVAVVRAVHSPASAEAANHLSHLADALNAKLLLVPGPLAATSDMPRAAAAAKLNLGLIGGTSDDPVIYTADPTEQARPVEARLTSADDAADSKIVARLIGLNFKGPICVVPLEPTLESLTKALDAFAKSLNNSAANP